MQSMVHNLHVLEVFFSKLLLIKESAPSIVHTTQCTCRNYVALLLHVELHQSVKSCEDAVCLGSSGPTCGG